MSASADDLIRPEVLALSAYKVLSASGMIKLDAMENPYRLSAGLRDSIAEMAHDIAFNRYPDASASELKAVLRVAMRVPEHASLVLGNGSDELIQMIELALARPGATVLAPEPGFVMYRRVADYCGLNFVGVPLKPDFSLDLPAMLEAIEQARPSLVFLAYPHNPTGVLFAQAEVEAILQASPGLVVVDEAYTPFAGGATFMARLGDFPNLIVMRTLSKLGLAGLRLGFMTGAPDWMDQLEKVRLPYNISTMTQAIATRVLGSMDALENQANSIVEQRARVFDELSLRNDITVVPSHANFLMIRVPDADRLFESLKERRVLIKNLHGSHPLLDNCVRVTIGSPSENDVFLAQFVESL